MSGQIIDNNTLIDLYIPNGVREIHSGEYFNCPKLKRVFIPPSVVLVKQGAFASCPQLEYIECSPNTQFEDYVFNNSHNIKQIRCQDVVFRVQYLPTHAYFLGILTEKQNNKQIFKGGFVFEDHLGQVERISKYITYLGVVCSSGKEYTWFGDSPQLAIVAAEYKASQQSFNTFFKCQLVDTTLLNWGQLELLMGVCRSGTALWVHVCNHYGYDINAGIPLKIIRSFLNEYFPSLSNRLEQAILYQSEHFNWLQYDQLYSGNLFIKEYNRFLDENPEWNQ